MKQIEERASIGIPFAIGDHYWLPLLQPERVEIVCPVCAGNGRLTVILGDGERVLVPCDGCGLGFEGPRGYVAEIHYNPSAKLVEILAIDSMRDGKWRVSTDDQANHDFEELCATEAEAIERSGIRCAEWWESVMVSHQRKRKPEKAGWTVRYHRQQIKELKKKIEWHEEKVQAVK